MTAPTVEINVTPSSNGTTVKLNGVQVDGLCSVAVSAEVNKPTKLVMEFIAANVKVTGEIRQIDGCGKPAAQHWESYSTGPAWDSRTNEKLRDR